MENEITKTKIEKYFGITEKAFGIIKENVINGKEKEAKEIFDMVQNYISDAKHFFEKGKWVECFGALNYAHGWIDCGVRLGIFDVNDNNLFTIK